MTLQIPELLQSNARYIDYVIAVGDRDFRIRSSFQARAEGYCKAK